MKSISADQDYGSVSRIRNLPAPANNDEPARVTEVLAYIAAMNWKHSVKVATQANLNLSAPGATIDGITMTSGDRFLVRAQTTGSQNGIYIWNGAASAATRSTDADTALKLEQAIVTVEEGTSAGRTYRQTQINFTLGSGSVTFMVFGMVPEQHVVEFIEGTGIITDGVLDASDTASPFSWTVPSGVRELSIAGCGGGGGGAGGQNTGTQRAGSGGGASGISTPGIPVFVRPGDALTITLGAGGPGSAAGSGFNLATAGGDTIIAGLTRISPAVGVMGGTAESLILKGGGPGARNNTAGTAGGGGAGGASTNGASVAFLNAGGGAGSAAAASPTAGGNGTEGTTTGVAGFSLYTQGGSGGGAASTSPTTAGANGGSWRLATGNKIIAGGMSTTADGVGSQDGTNSYGGGGDGGASLFGRPGLGGDGNVNNATAASGYGSGGAGGGGNGDGTAGAPGYLRISYWSIG